MIVYKLATIGAPVRGGANQAVDATIRGVAKTNAQFPFTIANEIVAEALGRALGLPIPAGVLAEDGGATYYLSLDVSATGNQLPPIIAQDFVSNHQNLAAGAVVFDILIANNDRHTSNISLDPGFAPPRPSLFDHGHALLGSGAPSGVGRLVAAVDDLGCTGALPLGGNRQILLDLIANDADLSFWTRRVMQLPDYIIEDCCASVSSLGINVDVAIANELGAWLKARRDRIEALITAHAAEFAGIAQWNLLLGPGP